MSQLFPAWRPWVFVAAAAAFLLVGHTVRGEEPIPATNAEATITLPATCDLERLTELVSQTAGIRLHWSTGRIQGNIRLSLPQALPIGDLWTLYNQVLGSQGLTTVLGGLPGLYAVVPISDAAQASALVSAADLQATAIRPGFAAVIRETKNLSAESAIKLLGSVISGQGVQFKSMGGDGHQLVVAAPTALFPVVEFVLSIIDRPGQAPGVRLVKPERTAPNALQAAATAAWNALGRIEERTRGGEIQVAPDGLQLLLIANAADLDGLEKLVQELDRSEPVESRSYRPRYFTLEEVAGLILQTLGTTTKVDIIRDRLTGSLLIKATTAEHQRIAALIASLDEAPASARRQARALQVKHRKADEMARLLMSLVAAGHVDGAGSNGSGGGTATTTPGAQSPPPVANDFNAGGGQQMGGQGFGQGGFGQGGFGQGGFGGGGFAQGINGTNQYGSGMAGSGQRSGSTESTAPVTSTSADGSLVITADPVTNRLLVLGEPRIIDQLQDLLAQVDQRQPQVDIEVVLVSVTDEQNRDLGIELARQMDVGGADVGIASLFGISSSVAGSLTNRATGNVQGFGAVVLKPGHYAAVIKALEAINKGRTTIRSQLVVANNGQASINAIVQQPFSATNSSTQVSTTSYGGTSDAGTQITLSPRVSPADYVTVDYTISQSAFLGSPTVTDSGIIPPTKRTDNVASTATVPDSYTIALGGLSNRNEGHSESRIPFLGAIPFLGNLFKSQNDQRQDSRFYVFIRASILRQSVFGDLRYRSDRQAAEGGIGSNGDPVLEPQLMR